MVAEYEIITMFITSVLILRTNLLTGLIYFPAKVAVAEISFKLCQQVADIFPSSMHVRLLGLDTAADRIVWDYAKVHGFTLVASMRAKS